MKIYTNRKTLLRAGSIKNDLIIDDFEQHVARTQPSFIKELAVRAELMRQACLFDDFEKLELDENSMKFFHNSTLLVKFFQELAIENVPLDKLSEHDAYQSYSIHIDILSLILSRYLTILYNLNSDDMITIPTKWWRDGEIIQDINLAWVKSVKHFEFYYDGILSRFDLSLIKSVTDSLKKVKGAEVLMFVHTDSWFQKSILRLDDYGDFEADKIYLINGIEGTSEIITEFEPKTNATLNSVSMTSMFGPYIKLKSQELIQSGVDIKDIAVIYTDEKIRPALELYADDILDFDHTESLANMKMMRIMANILIVAENEDLSSGFNSSLHTPETKILARHISSGDISLDFVNGIGSKYNETVGSRYVVDLLAHLADLSTDDNEHDMIIILIETLNKYSEVFAESTLSEILEFTIYQADFIKNELFMEDKIKTYDFVDTRGVSSKYLIIVGFEKGLVPKPAKKDLFLDTSIRMSSEMPIYSDRIHMQLHYWQTLLSKAENSFICYHDGDKTDVSLFATEFGLNNPIKINNELLLNEMIDIKDIEFVGNQETIKSSVPKKRYLSATKLKAFLECKRKYYYKYIAKAGEPITYGFLKEEREIGLAIHDIMEKELVNIHNIPEFEMIQNSHKRLESLITDSNTSDFNLSIWKRRLSVFIAKEYSQISNGSILVAIEKPFSFDLNNITYSGIVDRIDTGANGSILVSDYKTGKTPSLRSTGKGETNFQPEFYKMLLEKNSEDNQIIDFMYRNVKNASYKQVSTSPARQQAFLDALKSFEDDDGVYDMTKLTNSCTFCPYKKLCGK